MQILKVLSLLLCYPEVEIIETLDPMSKIIEEDGLLSEANKSEVLNLIDSYRNQDLLELQENYVALFDRGRYLSLHIFEHVHGESRDRGQAMVNLLQLYESNGFEINAHELPDYIPLFLEFLSRQAADETVRLLQDAMPVLSLLGARLHERNSAFSAVFDALADLAGEPEAIADIRQQAAMEAPDETLLHMDEIWEEEAVSFMGAGDACKSKPSAVSPVRITPHDEYLKSLNRSL